MSANPALLPNTNAGPELMLFVCEAPPSAQESNRFSASIAESLRRVKAFLNAERLTISGSRFAIGQLSC
jgi:hypothetical protein